MYEKIFCMDYNKLQPKCGLEEKARVCKSGELQKGRQGVWGGAFVSSLIAFYTLTLEEEAATSIYCWEEEIKW